MEESMGDKATAIAVTPTSPSVADEKKTIEPSFSKSWTFRLTFVALCLLSFISALDATVVGTALPTITQELGGQHQYTWILNSFILASSAPQPLFGQVANIFGRRNPVIVAVVLFILGSGIAGGAHNPAMFIAGRAIQGVGGGGIYALIDIICCDLVPLRERGKYLGFMFSWAGVGATVGPVVGGALAQVNWRWIFYLNIPVCAVTLLIVLLSMKFKQGSQATVRETLRRVDFFGGALFITAMTSLLFGLVTGGIQYPWGSWRVILSIVLGVVGWVAFHFHQASPWCKEPSVPPRLFKNRTSATGFGLACISTLNLQAVLYFLPIYFQAVKGTSALQSGIDFLPFAVTLLFWAALAGALLTKTGKYRWLHCTSFGLAAVGTGLFTLLNENSSKAAWASFQVVAAAGYGSIQSILLPSILAALPESDVATASATYAFCRSFGQIWGVTLSTVSFNAAFNSHLNEISDTVVRSQLSNGQAYSRASQQFLNHLPELLRTEAITAYTKSLQVVWYVVIGFCCAAFLLVGVEREIPLRNELETEYGLNEKKSSQSSESNSVHQSDSSETV